MGRSTVTIVPRPTASKTGLVIRNDLVEVYQQSRPRCGGAGGGGGDLTNKRQLIGARLGLVLLVLLQ